MTVSRDTYTLQRWYWGYLLTDLLVQLRKMPSKENKDIVHRELKEYIGVKTTSGMSYGQLRLFINKVLMICAREKGIFVRTSGEQPDLIADMPLGSVWSYL